VRSDGEHVEVTLSKRELEQLLAWAGGEGDRAVLLLETSHEHEQLVQRLDRLYEHLLRQRRSPRRRRWFRAPFLPR
jgi:hypothetical protein